MNHKYILFFVFGIFISTLIFYLYISNNETVKVEIEKKTNTKVDCYYKLFDKTSSDTILIYPSILCPFFTEFKQSNTHRNYFNYMFRLGSERLFIILFNIVHKLYNYEGDISVITKNKEIFGKFLEGMLYQSIKPETKFNYMKNNAYEVIDRFFNNFCSPVSPKSILNIKLSLSYTKWYEEIKAFLILNEDIKEVDKVKLVRDINDKVTVTVLDYMLICIHGTMRETI